METESFQIVVGHNAIGVLISPIDSFIYMLNRVSE
jgi:hypothetical protein